MEEALALIDKIIDEHKTLAQKFQTLEQVANDAEALAGLEKAKDAFMPGRPGEKEGLQKLQVLLETIKAGIQAHFNREETGLLSAFKKHGTRELVTALHSLLLEHKDIHLRFEHAEKHLAELESGKLSRHVWEASAHDMRAHISHTRNLFEAHAQNEMDLLQNLKNILSTGQKR